MNRPQFIQSSSEATEEFAVVPYRYQSNSPPESPLLLFDFPRGLIVSMGGHYLPGEFFDYFNPLLIGATTLKWVRFHGLENFPCLNLLTKRPLELLIRMPVFYPPFYTINYNIGTCTRAPSPHQVFQRLQMGTVPTLPFLEDEDEEEEMVEDDEEFIDDLFAVLTD